MTTSFIVNDAKIGIVMENDGAGFVGTNATGVGALYDSGDQTYAVISHNTDVTIDTFGQEQETFQVNEDHYDHYIDLRYVGSGSITAVALDDTGSGLDAYNLIYAATHLPNGNSKAAAAVDMAWDPTLDTNGGTMASDLRGYAIIVEKMVTSGSIYYQWIFHNAKIEVTPSFGAKQATRINLKWDDARLIQITNSGSTFANHADA